MTHYLEYRLGPTDSFSDAKGAGIYDKKGSFCKT